MHIHEDADGNRIGTTVIVRASPWDAAQRELALTLHREEKRRAGDLCPCGCGLPAADTLNKDQPFLVDHYTCHATQARAVERELWEKSYTDRKAPIPAGVNHYVVPFDPERDAHRVKRKTSPAAAAADQAPEPPKTRGPGGATRGH